MTKKKLVITITSLCLVVVAAVAAVVGILAATNMTLNTKVKVTYTPNKNVIAEIGARYQKNGSGTATTLLADTSITYATPTTTYSIGSTGATEEIALEEVNATTNPYIVFEFSFKNTSNANQTQSKYLNVAMTNNLRTENMTAKTYYSTTQATDLTKTTIEKLGQTSTLANIEGCGKNGTAYVYIIVEATVGESGSYGSLESETLVFNLTASDTTAA